MEGSGQVERYGVLEQNDGQTDVDLAAEELNLLGYTVLSGDFSDDFLNILSERFASVRTDYFSRFSSFNFETDVIRVLPFFDDIFFRVLFHPKLQLLLKQLLGDYFIVNQVNGLINSAGSENYSQFPWHRDLPFRHLTMSRPIAINALFALDDFTLDNGCTYVIPGSHKVEKFPSDLLVGRAEAPVTVKAGTFICLDCMTYHRGGFNATTADRRAINHVFTIPAWRQQFHLPSIFGPSIDLSEGEKMVLGYGLDEFRSHDDWFASKLNRTST